MSTSPPHRQAGRLRTPPRAADRGGAPGLASGPACPAWYLRQLATLPAPRARVFEWLRTHPEAVVLVATLVRATADAMVLAPSADGPGFRAAGASMWGPHGLDVFADDWLQIGPVYLGLLGGATRLLEAVTSSAVAEIVLWVAQALLVVLAAMAVARAAARRRGSSGLAARWAVGLALGLGGLMTVASEWGHPEEPLLAVMLLGTAFLVDRGRPGPAGLLLGLAVSVKQWALMGVAVLLGARGPGRLRSVAGAVVAAAAVTVLSYGPFVLFGRFDTFDKVWNFQSSAPLAWLWHAVGIASWTGRLLQGAVAAGVGALVALRRQGDPELAVLAVVGVRVILDPRPLPYYVAPVALAFLVWLWTAPASFGRPARLLATALPVAVVFLVGEVPAMTYWSAVDALIVLALVSALARTRSPDGRPVRSGGGVGEWHRPPAPDAAAMTTPVGID